VRRSHGAAHADPPGARDPAAAHALPHCGEVSQADIPGISVRSLLFALRNDGRIDEEAFARLDRSWRKHRAARGLDAYGRTRREGPASACGGHP
jgi:hypothetical protein